MPNIISRMGAGLTPEQNRIITDIRQYCEDARSIRLQPSRSDRDRRNFYALSMVLFALSNRLIDLGRETVYSKGYAGPEEELKNKVIFKRLADYQVIGPATRQDLIRLVDFRNRCSHHFHEVTREELMEISDCLPRYEKYVSDIQEELMKTRILSKKEMILVAGLIIGCLIIVIFFFFG